MNTPATLTITLPDLENLIRRIIREELAHQFSSFLPDDAIYSGPDDPEGDAELLADALLIIEQYEKNPEGWKTLEEFEAELLAEAEAL